MAAQKLFTNDICLLQELLVVVEITHGDVETHLDDVRAAYPDGFTCFRGISRAQTQEFIDTGAPPQGTVIITWIDIPGVQVMPVQAGLVPEFELEIVDRAVSVGDVVKRNAKDTMSGTVVETHIQVYLAPPRRWTRSQDTAWSPSSFTSSSDFVGPISTADLSWPPHYEPSDIVIYQNWLGRVTDVWEEITLKLSNGSVVIPEKEDEITPIHSTVSFDVGDWVETKKSNLRRGRWIFGAYNPNIKPEALVIKRETTSLLVEWLENGQKDESHEMVEEPPSDIGKDIIETGNLRIYDDQVLPSNHPPGPHKSQQTDRRSLDVETGETVVFHDLAAACIFYNSNNRLSGSKKLARIPRSETLGYDMNSFVVARKETTVVVQWQDLRKSIHKSCDIIPTIDMDDDDDVWPGETICTRDRKDPDTTTYSPKRIGVAQAVNAKDRVAKVRWFEGAVTLPNDDKSVFFPGSWTGLLQPQVEDMSLYDIWTVPALTRRIGDFVMLVGLHLNVEKPQDVREKPSYGVINKVLNEASGVTSIFGQIVELGLEGTITVRLGALSKIQDIKVPIECTHVVQTSDWSDDEMGEDSSNSIFEQAMSLFGHQAPASEVAGWRDEHNQPVNQADEDGWEDEDENSDDDTELPDAPEHTTGDDTPVYGTFEISESTDSGEHHKRPQVPNDDLSDHKSLVRSSFNFVDMMSRFTEQERPKPVQILEGECPDDHHFRDERANQTLNKKLLKRVQHELRVLEASLPEGVFVRTWEQTFDLFRVLIIGPLDTPYEYSPIVIDFHFHRNFPKEPPSTFFHSWTDGSGPINPNLYEDGKICLSLLGTWPGQEKNQGWTPESTVLQIVVSILGLVLVKEPYYNEAGFEVRTGTAEAQIPAALYSERTYFRAREFIRRALDRPVKGFEDVIECLYKPDANHPNLLARAIWSAVAVLKRSSRAADDTSSSFPGRKVSRGALVPLRRQIMALTPFLNEEAKRGLEQWIEDDKVPTGGPGKLFDELAAATDT